jgi:hypothetical protein
LAWIAGTSPFDWCGGIGSVSVYLLDTGENELTPIFLTLKKNELTPIVVGSLFAW